MLLVREDALMLQEENKAIVRRLLEGFFNTGDPDVAEEVLAPDYIDHSPSTPETRGLDNIKRSVGGWRTAFPDTVQTVEDMVAEGDKVAARWITRATHQGEFMGIPATGNRIEVAGFGIFRMLGGKIVESWDTFDATTMMQQLSA
jgi:steroid delta-isomerase-like uncharacterized protein